MENMAITLDTQFWQNKTVLVTGHTGFKGSWLALWLQTLNAQVVGFSLPPHTTPNLFTSAQISKYMLHIIGDITDYAVIHRVIKQHKPDIIFHLAAQALVRQSYFSPIETLKANVLGTMNVLEAMRQTDYTKALLCITSDKCYVNQFIEHAYEETDSLGGRDPYSASKACAELIVKAYWHSYFSAEKRGLATARAGNVIGGGDWAHDRLIPDIMRARANNHPLTVRYPDAIRPWQFVLDALFGYLRLAHKLYLNPNAFSEAWNFGPDRCEAASVRTILNYFSVSYSEIKTSLAEENYLCLNSNKAKSQLNWKTRYTLEKTLAVTDEWYIAFSQMKEMRSFSLNQIKHFISDRI